MPKIQTPVRPSDHGTPLQRPRKAWNKIPPAQELAVRKSLREGVGIKATARKLGISTNAVSRISQEMRSNGTAAQSKRIDYRKILAEAREYREKQLAEMRAKRVSETNGRGL